MRKPFERINDGWSAVVAAALWNIFDALVHVAVDQVEPLRIAGNVAVFAATGLVRLVQRQQGSGHLAALVSGAAAGLVLAFNLAWVASEGELPAPAAVFILVSLGLLVWAAFRFLVEALPLAGDDQAGETRRP